MNELLNAITKATTALKGLTPSTLTAVQLNSTRALLDSIDITSILGDYSESLPEKSNSDDSHIELEKEADRLNKKIDPLNDALEEVKRMRSALNLDALDPVIQSGRNIVRKLYDYTASMQ